MTESVSTILSRQDHAVQAATAFIKTAEFGGFEAVGVYCLSCGNAPGLLGLAVAGYGKIVGGAGSL